MALGASRCLLALLAVKGRQCFPNGVQGASFWWAIILICYHGCKFGSLWMRDFMMLFHAKASAGRWVGGRQPGTGHSFLLLNGGAENAQLYYMKKINTRENLCSICILLFIRHRTRPTGHSPCPREHWKWDFSKIKIPWGQCHHDFLSEHCKFA